MVIFFHSGINIIVVFHALATRTWISSSESPVLIPDTDSHDVKIVAVGAVYNHNFDFELLVSRPYVRLWAAYACIIVVNYSLI